MITTDLLRKHHGTEKFKQNLNLSKLTTEGKHSLARRYIPIPTQGSHDTVSTQLKLIMKGEKQRPEKNHLTKIRIEEANVQTCCRRIKDLKKKQQRSLIGETLQ